MTFKHAEKPWIIDTSSLVQLDLFHPYEFIETRFIWDLLAQSQILIIEQVIREAKDGEATFHPWLKDLPQERRLSTTSNSYFTQALEIQRTFPQLDSVPETGQAADAFLIIAARELGGVVVTEEAGWSDAPPKGDVPPFDNGKCRIPSACAYYGVSSCKIFQILQHLFHVKFDHDNT